MTALRAGVVKSFQTRKSRSSIKMDNMHILLKLICLYCRKAFTVDEENVEDDQVFCPHCQNEVPVPDIDEEL